MTPTTIELVDRSPGFEIHGHTGSWAHRPRTESRTTSVPPHHEPELVVDLDDEDADDVAAAMDALAEASVEGMLDWAVVKGSRS